MTLSVLIPTTPDRADQFNRLYFELLKQANDIKNNHPSLGDVEILYDDSKRYLEGGLSIGEKREKLKERATGDWLTFKDADDDVAPNFIESVLRVIYHHCVDLITFNGIIKNDHYWAYIEMKFDNDVNEELRPEGIVKRRPWHVCVIRSEIAKTEIFEPLNHNEDWDWMRRILPKIQSSYHLDVALIQYNHSEKNSEADKIIQHEASNH